jgi:hypothetical protein
MNWGVHESFCEMPESIPPKLALRASEVERQLADGNFHTKQMGGDHPGASILNFHNIFTPAVCEVCASMAVLPVKHRSCYGKVVQRWVETGELPSSSPEHFSFASVLKTQNALWRISAIRGERFATN